MEMIGALFSRLTVEECTRERKREVYLVKVKYS